jgi:hypothetical protein
MIKILRIYRIDSKIDAAIMLKKNAKISKLILKLNTFYYVHEINVTDSADSRLPEPVTSHNFRSDLGAGSRISQGT